MDRYFPSFSNVPPEDEAVSEWELIGATISSFLTQHHITKPYNVHICNAEPTENPAMTRLEIFIAAPSVLYNEPYTAVVWIDGFELVFHLWLKAL
jgi:hypothetical protein